MSQTLNRTIEWFQIAKPNPTEEDFSVQFGVHCEEFVETLQAIDSTDPDLNYLINQAQDALQELGNSLKNKETSIVLDDLLRIQFLDGLSDSIVTAVGCAHTAGLNIIGAMDEVNRSNFSKFEDGNPVFKKNGKIAKGKEYIRPDLTTFI